MKYWQDAAPTKIQVKAPTLREQMLNMLETKGPMTATEMHQVMGHSRSTVSHVASVLHSEHKLRICEWRRNLGDTNGRFAGVYALADGLPDAPSLEKLTRAERDRNYNERKKAGLTRPWKKEAP